MKNKAQVKFGETIAIIIIVYLVLFFGITWYNNANQKDLKNLYEKDQMERSFEKFHYLNTLELIRVSKRGVLQQEIDMQSIKIFADYANTNGKEYVQNLFGNSQITIEYYKFDTSDTKLVQLEDNNGDPIKETLYDSKPPQDKKITGQNTFKNVLTVRDTINKKNYIGVITITEYLIK